MRLWLGQLLGVLADWALRSMLLIWVYKLTHSGVAVSLVGLAALLPLLALAPVAGVFVDRWSRAATMAGAMLARGVLLLPALEVHDRADLPLILLATLLITSAAQFFIPAAAAAVPAVVGQEQIGQANGVLSLVNAGGAVFGPGAGAVLFADVGPHGAAIILASLYVLAAPLLAQVAAPRPRAAGTSRPSVTVEMMAGLRYVRRSPLLIALIAVAIVALLGIGALSVLDVVFVTRALHLRSEAVGVLLTSNGIGLACGGIAISLLSSRVRRHYHLLLGLSTICNGLCLVAYAVAPTLLVAAAALCMSGTSFALGLTSFMTLIQLECEDAFLGRVMSLIYTGMALAIILSMVCGGALADLVSIRWVIGAGAVLLTSAGVLCLLAIRTAPAPRAVTRTCS